MLRLALTLIIFTCFHTSTFGQVIRTAEFGEAIDDWFIFDLDGDGETEILAFFPLTEAGRPFALARRKGDSYTIERSVMAKDVVSMALGDFGMMAGRQIALMHPNKVTFLGEKDGKLISVGRPISFRNIIRSPQVNPPGFWHWQSDIDNDGLDDLYLPGDEGIIVVYGEGKGKFTPPQLIDFLGSRRIETDSAGHLDFERSYPRPSFLDINGDNLVDLCWFDEKGLSFLPQGEKRTFDKKSLRSFDLAWLSAKDVSGVVENTEIKLEDLNGDERPDLFLTKMTTPAAGITKMKTTIVILLNQGMGDFTKRPDFALRVGGIIGSGPYLTDLDGDGTRDIVFGSYGTSVSDALQRALGNVKVKFNIYLGRKGKSTPFAAQPSFSQSFRIPKSDYTNWGVRNNFVLNEDLNADGIADQFRLTPSKGGHIISVHPGMKTKSGIQFSEQPFLKTEAKGFKNFTFRTMKVGKPVCLVLINKTSLATVTLD